MSTHDPRSWRPVIRQRPALWGKLLDSAIRATPAIRPILIEDLLPQKSIIMVSSPAGQGKSVVTLTMVGQGALALPVFKHLPCPRPIRTFILCPERPADELHERIANMRQAGAAWDSDKIAIDDGLVGLCDIANDSSVAEIIKALDAFAADQSPPGLDLICFEGMYAMSRKPLASEETANDFARFNAVLQYRYGCSLWYNNHTIKDRHDKEGNELPRTWFGSQMLMAQVTGAYIFERIKGTTTRSRMINKKDTTSGLAEELIFDYDPESFTVELATDLGLVTNTERLRAFVNSCHRSGKAFSYTELAAGSHLSRSTIQRRVVTWVAKGALRNRNGQGQSALYEALHSV